jgi:ABC-type hemin transport system substrate-binding protein
MAAISSTAGMQAATQAAMQQLRVQQARQTAEKAEVAARNLRAKADAAQNEADRAQENARTLYVRSGQAESAAGHARQGVAAMESAGEARGRLFHVASQTVERVESAAPATPTPPVVNTSGQLTGTVVNTTA